MNSYNHKEIESKWQKYWEDNKFYQAEDFSSKPKFYSLFEFNYPSGDGLHVGHVRTDTAMDIISRKRRMQGYNVLYPVGWDSFGLPTENYAIKTGISPQLATKQNTDNFRRQMKSLGISVDWSREIDTSDPNYYKWTQWIFLQMFKKGLAYKAKIEINWCPKDKIGLANEEVIDGKCERCGTAVEKREKEQWMLAITKYADRLDRDLDTVDYLPQIKLQQRNWIGKSEGAEIEFEINPPLTPPEGRGTAFGYHHTDPKTWQALQDRVIEMRENPTEAEEILWQSLRANKTDLHFRRQHIIGNFIVDFVCLTKRLVIEVDGDVHDYQKQEDQERTEFLNQRGFQVLRFRNEEVRNNLENVFQKIEDFLEALPFGEGLGGVSSINVFTTRADTLFGATYLVVAPEHQWLQQEILNLKSEIRNKLEIKEYINKTKDKTEIERTDAKKAKTGVEIKGIKAINPATSEEIPVWVADYVLGNYGTGAIMAVPAHDERDFQFAQKYNLPIKNITPDWSLLEKFGKKVTKYKLRDWIFSRQRYWGEPIPLVNCEKCGWVAIPEKDLPVKLPEVENYKPTDTGESPLSNIAEWVNTKCPQCGSDAKRETDVMPNWAGSSWYYLRYVDPQNDKVLADQKKLKYWTPVDWYNGGMEHTTLHLLYSRFWHKFLFDIGVVPTNEPYVKRTSHGLILAKGGEKMSKSKGNVINPDDVVEVWGADSLRLYEMFMGPFTDAIAWNTDNMIGVRRFLEKVWRISLELKAKSLESENLEAPSSKLLTFLHKTIKKVTEDIEALKFNTAISAMMVFVNELDTNTRMDSNDTNIIPKELFETFLKLLAPFAPHITEELWRNLGHQTSIHLEAWPKYDEEKMVNEKVTIVVQINGKVRSQFEAEKGISETAVKNKTLTLGDVQKWLVGKEIKKIIFVPDKLINFVV